MVNLNTIVNVLNPSEAVGQNFFIGSDAASTAFSVARALRACPNVTANFIVSQSSNQVSLYAKQKGSIFGMYSVSVQSNIPSNKLSVVSTDGTSTSTLNNANVSVGIGIYGYQRAVLEKNAHNGEVAFDVSSVLGSYAEYGKVTHSYFDVKMVDESGTYSLISYNLTCYFTKGYKTKDSSPYLYISNTPQIALAVDRGTSRNVFNNTILYVYDNTIPLTVYRNSAMVIGQSVEYTVTYYNSALQSLGTSTGSASVLSYVAELSIPLSSTYFTPNCFYVDVTIGQNTLRYNVIKPLKMTEENTRLYWRNEYGGVQFFDFTGGKTETRDAEANTYHRGDAIYNYYEETQKDYEAVYSVNVDEKINVTSHLIEKDGRWQFDSLVRAKKVWTIIDGVEYGVIVDSVSVEETEQNDIYRANVSFHTTELQ